MPSTSHQTIAHRVLLSAAWALPLAGAFVAAPAAAQLAERVTIENRLGFSNSTGETQLTEVGGSDASIFLPGAFSELPSELGLQYTGTADDNGFFFLHNDYCVGMCSIATSTTITFTVVNTGSTAIDLRFDSLITPGHAAFFNGGNRGGDDGSAGFQFDVFRTDGSVETNLYTAAANVTDNSIELDTGGLDYNGLTFQASADNSWQVYDWGATNLNLLAGTLLPGETTQIIYRATYRVNGNAFCTDLFVCTGFQIAFGDPRNKGGVEVLSARSALALDAPEPELEPILGRIFDPFLLTGTVVNAATTPLPGAQAPFTAPNYGPTFVSRIGAVPEPTTWLSMIAGFALTGGALRRRRPIAA